MSRMILDFLPHLVTGLDIIVLQQVETDTIWEISTTVSTGVFIPYTLWIKWGGPSCEFGQKRERRLFLDLLHIQQVWLVYMTSSRT